MKYAAGKLGLTWRAAEMPRSIRRPFNPALAEYQRQQAAAAEAERRDRRATDLLRNAQVAPMEIDNPLEAGGQIVAMRSMRDDPLARMHSHGTINEAQYHGGRAYQCDFEAVERGPQAIDPAKPYVDCSPAPQYASDAHNKALDRLNAIHHGLGQSGAALTTDFLIHRQSPEQICAARSLLGVREKLYIGRRIRECLDELAVIYGFATGER